MTAKAEVDGSRGDMLKLGAAIGLLLIGIGGFYLFADQLLVLRVLGLLIVAVASGAIALRTDPGRRAWLFAQEARNEVRKVIWPTRQETTQTTLLVMVMVLVVAVILWFLDMFLAWAVKFLVHRGGCVMTKRWYVVHAYSGYEKQVKKALEERVARSGLEERFGEILVPTEEVVEMRMGQQRKSERKFFPGYVLVNMEMGDDTWHLVRDCPRVMGFIGGTSDKPAPISDKEADVILNRVQEGVEKPRHKVVYEPGEVVRVIDGPFADFNGVVEEINYEKSRLRVSVLIFGRSTPVDLEFGQVEKG